MRGRKRSTEQLAYIGIAIAVLGIAVLAVLPRVNSDVGLQTAPNPWGRICAHNRAYIAAFEKKNQAGMREAAKLIRDDIRLGASMQGGTEWFTTLAEAAETGNVATVRQNVQANCPS